MENKDILLKSLIDKKYYTNTDLRMNKNYGFLLSNQQLNEYLDFKESVEEKNKITLPLVSWNSKMLYLFQSSELMSAINEYIEYFFEDYSFHKSSYTERNLNEVFLGIVCSELEGTLKIEGVNTTRRQIEKVIKENKPKDKNDLIVINMIKGLEYIKKEKSFNKDTLKKLYDILSNGCLDKEDEIGELYYRNDSVYVAEHRGCPVDKIEECMDSLFKYVSECLISKDNFKRFLLPFIVHYYILYIHPYFDYNGRTARMAQLWMYFLLGDINPIYLSEAINDQKNDYYKAIDNTRYSKNDLSYFIIYLLKLINSYSLVQKNLEAIKEDLENEGETITEKELHYLKKIIINQNIKWFNFKKFIEFENLDITRQGALKILNNFVDLGFLETKMNSKNEKIFILNDKIIKFDLK